MGEFVSKEVFEEVRKGTAEKIDRLREDLNGAVNGTKEHFSFKFKTLDEKIERAFAEIERQSKQTGEALLEIKLSLTEIKRPLEKQKAWATMAKIWSSLLALIATIFGIIKVLK